MGPSPVSDQLAAAQAALLARRRTLGLSPLLPAERPLPPHQPPSLPTVVASLPPHLGWNSAPATRAVRAAQQRRQQPAHPPAPPSAPTPPTRQPAPPLPRETSVYPDLALAILRHRAAAAGRVWLVLRALDSRRCGWLPLSRVRQVLTDPDSPLRLCGRRQLRKLLDRGEGLFWTRTADRFWLRGIARVAAGLGVDRLALDAVTLPLARLCGPIRQARAQLYASFHSGRTAREKRAAPIARDSLRRLSARSRQTQVAYERAAGITPRRNVALGPPAKTADREELGWRHGRALFLLKDHGGRHGAAGTTYFAWQLPNSYSGARGQRARRRGGRRRLNRRLRDLLHQGRTGNGQPVATPIQPAPRYCRDAATACRRGGNACWPAPPGSTQIWYVPRDARPGGTNLTPFIRE